MISDAADQEIKLKESRWKKGSRPRDLKADANNGGRPPADDLHAIAEAAVEDGHGEEGNDAAEEDEHLKKEEDWAKETYLRMGLEVGLD